MNRSEATAIADRELQKYRDRSYVDLEDLLTKVDAYEITASDRRYQIEVGAHWDDRPYGNIRVICSASSGFWGSIHPSSSDFIKTPTGDFIGE